MSGFLFYKSEEYYIKFHQDYMIVNEDYSPEQINEDIERCINSKCPQVIIYGADACDLVLYSDPRVKRSTELKEQVIIAGLLNDFEKKYGSFENKIRRSFKTEQDIITYLRKKLK